MPLQLQPVHSGMRNRWLVVGNRRQAFSGEEGVRLRGELLREGLLQQGQGRQFLQGQLEGKGWQGLCNGLWIDRFGMVVMRLSLCRAFWKEWQ